MARAKRAVPWVKDHNLHPWLDEWELRPGFPWQRLLEENIEKIKAAAVFVGPSGIGPWQQMELEAYLRQFVNRNCPVIPVILQGTDEIPKLPLFLEGLTWVDFRQNEPKPLERLIWGITGEKHGKGIRPQRLPAATVQEPSTAESIEEQKYIESLIDQKMLWIPGGRFRMGSEDISDNEKPVHWVRISPFHLAETPVTNRQYAQFLESGNHEQPRYWRDRRFSAPDQPVVGVSWDDAMAFCKWLQEATGQPYILPSEAQWEFAARGTDGRIYPWGDDPPDKSRACYGLDWNTEQPAPVGGYPEGQGPFGTLDQAGNVWEWCLDGWDAEVYAKRVQQELQDPVVESSDAVERVLRGGGWLHSADDLQAAYRDRHPARLRLVSIGFRVAVARASR